MNWLTANWWLTTAVTVLLLYLIPRWVDSWKESRRARLWMQARLQAREALQARERERIAHQVASQTVQGSVRTMKRGVGYCENTDCEDYAKGIFLLNHGLQFYCPRCRVLGHSEPESGQQQGNEVLFSEVRVEYGFNSIEKKYTEIAIVRDESMVPQNVYVIKTPLVKTENRALKMAEALLSSLNVHGLPAGEIPRMYETILSFDSSLEEFTAHCQKLHEQLQASPLARPLEQRSSAT